MRKSAAAARICRPIVVRFRSSVVAARSTPPTTSATIEIQRIRSEPTANAVLRPPSVPTDFAARAEREQVDVLEQEADREGGDEHRRRRGAAQRPEATRSITSESAITTREAGEDRDDRRLRRSR